MGIDVKFPIGLMFLFGVHVTIYGFVTNRILILVRNH